MSDRVSESEAVRAAEHNEFKDGVEFGLLEFIQYRTTPSMRGRNGRRMLLGALKMIAIIAAPLALLLPVGGMQFQLNIDTPGVRGSELAGLATVCFWIAAAGQAWNLIDWWRFGRHADSRSLWSAVVGVASAGLALWWFPGLMTAFAFTGVAVPIVLTGVLAVIACALQLVLRRPGSRADADRAARAVHLRALPEPEQARLRAERGEILSALSARGLIDQALADRAAGAALGDWWQLDRQRGGERA